jgi:hypothetical protein
MNINPEIIDNIKILTFIILVMLCLIFYPLAVIWSLNSLFSLTIKYNFWSWISVVILHIFFQGNAIIPTKKQK